MNGHVYVSVCRSTGEMTSGVSDWWPLYYTRQQCNNCVKKTQQQLFDFMFFTLLKKTAVVEGELYKHNKIIHHCKHHRKFTQHWHIFQRWMPGKQRFCPAGLSIHACDWVKLLLLVDLTTDLISSLHCS